MKGEFKNGFLVMGTMLIAIYHRFGWVNASYVYGLEILNAHMRRSLGTITPYDTYKKALRAQEGGPI